MGFVAHKPLKIRLYQSFTFFEYISFACFLYLSIKNRTFKKYIFFSAVVFSLFIIIYYLIVKFKRIDSVPIGIESILIIIFCFYFLYEETNDTTTLFIYNKASFWITLGIVLYLAGSFFIYIFASNISTKELSKYWFVTNILSIVKNIFFTIAIYIHSRPPSKEHFKYDLELGQLN